MTDYQKGAPPAASPTTLPVAAAMDTESVSPLVAPARIERFESAADAYKSVEGEILAMPLDQVGRITGEVTQAASVALGTVSNLNRLRPEFAELSNSDEVLHALDALPNVALATVYTNLQVQPKLSDNELQVLLEEGRPVRANLLLVAESLAAFGLLPATTVSAIREGQGNLDTAKDLIALGALFSSNWDRVSSKVPFGPELVERATKLGPQLLTAVGSREVGEVRSDPSFDWPALRARSFRLLVNTYEVLRRATSFVRWYQNDAAAFAPSLHNTFNKRRSQANRGNDDDTTGNSSNGNNPSSGNGASSGPGAGEVAHRTAVETVPLTSDRAALGANVPSVESGLAGSLPFEE